MKLNKNVFSIAPYEKRAAEILAKMTVAEKVGQTVLYGSMVELDKSEVTAGRVGALLNVPSVKVANEMQRMAVEETRLGIPLLIGHDVVHGDRTMFPSPLATAASWDMNRIEHAEMIAAREAYAEGMNWIYSPMIDITREPRWGRVAEGAGEDKYLGSLVAQARVRGFQTINPDTGYPYTAACFKHYCGYGLSEGGRDYETCDIGERTLHGEYLPVYRAALEAGAMTCMCSFNTLNGIPVTSSHYYLTELLRDKWGFDGFVVSDWSSVSELICHRVAKDKKDSARLAFSAGCDMDMHSAAYDEYLEEIVGECPELQMRLDYAVTRILAVKLALGLFENPYREEDNLSSFLRPDAREASRDMGRRSMVLLKNDNSTLPLKPGKKYLLVGPLADMKLETLGIWGGRGNRDDVVTLREALLSIDGIEVTYVLGCEFDSNNRAGFKDAARAAAGCDEIIFTCGMPCQWAGEDHGRVDMTLPYPQLELLKVLKGTGKPLTSVLMTPVPLCVPELDDASDALLLAWQGGVEFGNAIADVLFGKYNPSGKLPITFPRATGQVPIYYAYLPGGRPRENHNSRYIDCPSYPLYPFGYGLSYSDIEYSGVTLENDKITKDGTLHASVTVTNKSECDCEEVVQVYFRDLVSTIATPEKRLCEFEKVEIPAGGSVTVKFEIPASAFSFTGCDLEPVLESGEFYLYIGGDSDTGNKATFTVI